MAKTVVAIFNTREEGKDATDNLLINGFKREDIDVSSSDAYPKNDNDGENAVSRFFTRLFGDNDDTNERYTKVAEHGYIVTVHATSAERAQKASELLDAAGAIDVNEDYEKRMAADRDEGIIREHDDRGYRAVDDADDVDEDNETIVNENAPGSTRTGEKRILDEREHDGDMLAGDNREDRTIPVIEEDVKVDKKKVQTGGVRIRSRIIEKPVEEHIRLREEHIHVERKKVDRPATEEELEDFKNGRTT